MFLNQGKCCLPLFLAVFASSSAFAANFFHSVLDVNQYAPLATVTVGPDYVHKGYVQALNLLPPFQNIYTTDHSWQTVTDAGLFVGVERILTEHWQLQVGLATYVDTQLKPEGEVWQFGLPLFNDLTYRYHIHHTRLMLSGKFLTHFSRYQNFLPYFSWELGAAFNRANSYVETPTVTGASPMTPFANNSQTSFAYGLGLGMDYKINQNVRLGAGYQFASLGSASLGPSPAAATTQTLTISHLYTNQLRVQLTVIA